MTHPSGDPMVGRTVAHYEILTRLGGGGMGVVYKALDRKLGRPVALKFLPQQWSNDPGARERFVREAQAASATHHPNICTIHDVETSDEGQLFIVMAYYEGQTLKRRLEDGPLPVDDALDIATQVADGLARAHAQGVIHRDIKPGNLILTEDGVRIVDFGLATLVDSLQITVQGSTLGTAAYMSPEQVRGEEVDARADVWALGTVLYEMLAGRVPFRGAYAEAIAYAIRNDPPPPLRAMRPEIPEEVEQLVFRALHKDPAVRFASGREFARALRQVRGLTVPVDLRTQVVEPPPQPLRIAAQGTRRRARAGWAAAIILAVTASAGGWLFWPQPRLAIVVAPVSNLTGSGELDPYAAALTQLAILELGDSRDVRALPYKRLLPIVQPRFRDGRIQTTPDVLSAIGRHTTADVVVVPILEYDNEANVWRARAELRDPQAGPIVGDDITTEPMMSAIREEAAEQMVGALADAIEQRFKTRRSRVREWLRSLVGAAPPAAPIVRGLDAARAFEVGVTAYYAGEYHTAKEAFLLASTLDAQSPLLLAWASRAAALMWQEDEARDAAVRAAALLSGRIRPDVRLFVEAVAAEAQRDLETAGTKYAELASTYSDEPGWLLERGGYEDRAGSNREALATFDAVSKRDGGYLSALVESCRVNNELVERTAAQQQAERALQAYRELGYAAGEVQALFCLVDSMLDSDGALAAASEHAARALEVAERHQLTYNIGRAHHYIARVAAARGVMADAADAWSRAAAETKQVGNRFLEPRILMNLGVAYEAIGEPELAWKYMGESYDLYRRASNQGGAAEVEANIGMLEIEYGRDADGGLRRLENALGIHSAQGNRSFEVFAAYIKGEYYRYRGRLAEAIEELNRARSLAVQRGLDDDVPVMETALAQARFDLAEYGVARDLFLAAIEKGSPRGRTHARLRLAQTYLRLGAHDEAAAEVARASEELAPRRKDGLHPLLHLVAGELAQARGLPADASRSFGESAAAWVGPYPDEPSVAARGALGLLAALGGNARSGRARLEACVAQAEKMSRFLLASRCRVDDARVALRTGDDADAWRRLSEIPEDSAQRRLNPELRAAVHFWRGETLARRGDAAGAAREHAAAKKLVQDVRDRLPERYKKQFADRVDIRPILDTPAGVTSAASAP